MWGSLVLLGFKEQVVLEIYFVILLGIDCFIITMEFSQFLLKIIEKKPIIIIIIMLIIISIIIIIIIIVIIIIIIIKLLIEFMIKFMIKFKVKAIKNFYELICNSLVVMIPL